MPDVEQWALELDALMEQIGPRFARSEARVHVRNYIKGLISSAERKNSWQLAESIGDTTPYGLQQLLYRSPLDLDALRDDLRSYVVQHLADDDAVLVVDETGFVKKGRHSAGVAPQYSGAAGRIANSQTGVFLTYASVHGYSFIDRALYLPESWTNDRERCRRAGIPDTVEFTTKPQLAWDMLKRVVKVGIPFRWVTADSVYGDDRSFRLWLEEQEKAYVLAVSGKDYVPINWKQVRVSTLLQNPPEEGWQRLSAGAGSKGPRIYDWLTIPLMEPLVEGWSRWVLLRRNINDTSEIVAYACFAPTGTSLETLVQVAGRRWQVETCIEDAKGEVGLDHYEVRSWSGWYKHITLVCLAQALLTVIRKSALAETPVVQKGGPTSEALQSSMAAFKASRAHSSR